MATVLVCPHVLRDDRGGYYRHLAAAGHEIRFPTIEGKQLLEHELAASLGGIDAVLAGSEPYTDAVLSKFPALRVVARCGVGYDTVDIRAASRLGKAVCFTPGANHEAVGEQTFLMLLGLARRVVENHQLVADGKFKRRLMLPLRERTIGIVGLGRIGREVARLAAAFGMKVLASDPYVTPASVPSGLAELVSLDRLLAESDYVTLHTPLTDETRRFINDGTLARMKRGAFLVNTSRGGCVDEPALRRALESGHLAGAALDVFENEPPEGSPLLDAPNALLSPHVAGIDLASMAKMALFAAEAAVDLLAGRWPEERIVNEAEIRQAWGR
jgi:phosphoglycerate dehydrogenase-like enzyme